MNVIAAKNVREWFAFYGGEELGISLEHASIVWEAACASNLELKLPSLAEVKKVLSEDWSTASHDYQYGVRETYLAILNLMSKKK